MEIGCDNYVAAYHQAFGIPDRLLRAMAEAHGRRYSSSVLTPRQCQVLEMVGLGLYNDDIGKVLGIGIETVKSHLRVIALRLTAKNGTHAVAIAIRNGYIQPPPRPPTPDYRWDG